MKARRKRAIDLYSGVGGWSLGLTMAGIEVVASYERWGIANETNFKNNRHQAQTVDIRSLELADLPENIDIVVGSPPCTQFSFSNRGGGGNIDDGLQDVIKFLTIVDHLKPTVWAMENVPRMAGILETELLEGGRLSAFQHLNMRFQIINMEEYGLPQRRKRCIAGNFDFELLNSYAKACGRKTLGDIISALSGEYITDPLYGTTICADRLFDNEVEEPLNIEEERINRAGKQTHPVYNAMPFPDSLLRSVRTITATCTRVSRESVVIEMPNKPGSHRRLTLRERASLQGFPIDFQFYGINYGQKLRMIGNAMPPLFAYRVANALMGMKAAACLTPEEAIRAFKAPTRAPAITIPDRQGTKYPWKRKFRFAIPSLRLKSGVRFDLQNSFTDEKVSWQVAFTFGNSKSIQTIELNSTLFNRLVSTEWICNNSSLTEIITRHGEYLNLIDDLHMQDLWSHSGPGSTRPFMLLDQIDTFGRALTEILVAEHDNTAAQIKSVIEHEHGADAVNLKGVEKLMRNAPLILSGMLLGSQFNAKMAMRYAPMPERRRA